MSAWPGREDTYGRVWPDGVELCPVCGQPDNCGDCTHGRLTSEQAKELGALTGTDKFTWTGWYTGEEVSPEEPGKTWLSIEEEAAREIRAENICRALNSLVEAGDYA